MKRLLKQDLNLASHRYLWQHDEREWYGVSPHDYYAVGYRRRIRTIIQAVKRSGAKKCLEVGCAQGNMSLALAEEGISTLAMDINPEFLSYSRLKHQSGTVHWLRAEGYHLPLHGDSMEAIILAEILEHCAYPEKVLDEAFRVLAPGGVCIISTPNHGSTQNRLCCFSEVEKNRKSIEQHQFGPDGDDHLFLFSRQELESLVSKAGFCISQSRVLNHHFLMWQRLYHFRRGWPFLWNCVLEGMVTAIPGLRDRYTHCLFITCKKPGDKSAQVVSGPSSMEDRGIR